jgi:hypothetical protein
VLVWCGVAAGGTRSRKALPLDEGRSGAGHIQFGINDSKRFQLYGWARDADREPHQNWLGFDCEGEISAALGMQVRMRALL